MRLLILALLMALGGPAWCWPDRQVRLVVGFAAGGAADAAARIIADELQRKYKQPVVVENRSGSGGRIAMDNVAKADADGYALGLMVGGDAVVAASDPKLPYQLLRDFQYISTLSVYPFVVVANPRTSVSSMAQLIDEARKKAGGVTYATPGRGTSQHLAGELLAAMAGLALVDVPYRGTSAALADVLTSRVDATFAAYSGIAGYLQAGKLKALAVTSRERQAALPAVPALAELVPGYEVSTWMGLVAPARTPAAVVEQLSRDVQELLQKPDIQARFSALGLDTRGSSPADMRSRVEADLARWKQLLADRKIDLTQ